LQLFHFTRNAKECCGNAGWRQVSMPWGHCFRGKSQGYSDRLRTSPSTAQALPAPVIGIRLFDPLPPGLVGREVIGQEPSFLWAVIKNAWPRWIIGSSGLIPALAKA
jgi:hypothetical protein